MAKVFVDSDSETLDRITAALQAAGLSAVDVEPMARLREVARSRLCPSTGRPSPTWAPISPTPSGGKRC